MSNHPELLDMRAGDAYQEGLAAFDAGASEEDCPYATSMDGGNGTDRTRWFTEYFDRRVQTKFGPFLKKFGMSHP